MTFDNNEKDDFWDVEKLLPKKKSVPMRPFSTKEKVADVTIEADGAPDTGAEGRRLTVSSESEDGGRRVYTFDGGFIRSVSITSFVDKYDFYGNFRKAALLYYDFKTPKCDFAPFYSYMPQYSQFNSAQKSFYFYFRDCVRRKKYIRSDYSYLYLYVYEILNLPDKIPAEEGLELLIDLWRGYRHDLPNIDANMSLWVQDYCLVYGLPAPTERISDFIFDVINAAEFKEFYLADVEALGHDGINAMLACLSDYDWRRGKYAGGENKEIYAKHMLGAMGMLLSDLWHSGKIIPSDAASDKLARSAFRNSLCTHSVKCRLEIEYIPISSATELRSTVTAAIRYTENKLRALLGIKSRLAVKDLPSSAAAVIDAYFTSIFARAEAERQRAAMPEYEKLYDAQTTGLSFAGADEIERASWSTTARLVEESEEIASETASETAEDGAPAEAEDTEVRISEPSTAEDTDTYGLSEDEMEFIRAVLDSDILKIRSVSERAGALPEAIADRINEAFSDCFGDVIIESCDEGFIIIEDYTEDVDEWLTKRMK